MSTVTQLTQTIATDLGELEDRVQGDELSDGEKLAIAGLLTLSDITLTGIQESVFGSPDGARAWMAKRQADLDEYVRTRSRIAKTED